MKKYISLTAVPFLAVAFYACHGTGDGKSSSSAEKDSEGSVVVKQERPYLGSFEQITVLGSADVVYSHGKNYSIVVQCDSTYLPLVETTVESGTLTINLKGEDKDYDDSFTHNPDVTVYVTSPTIRIISVCGSGSFEAKGTINAKDFNTGIIGSGDLKFDSLICRTFNYQASGSGDADFKYVEASSIDFLSNGSGDAKVETIKSDSIITVGITGSGDIEFESGKAEKVNVVAGSSGNGHFHLDCSDFNMNASGSGHHILEGSSKHGSVKTYGSVKVENNMKRN